MRPSICWMRCSNLVRRDVLVPVVHGHERAAIDGHHAMADQIGRSAPGDELPAGVVRASVPVATDGGDGLAVGRRMPGEPHGLDGVLDFPLQAAGPDSIRVAVDVPPEQPTRGVAPTAGDGSLSTLELQPRTMLCAWSGPCRMTHGMTGFFIQPRPNSAGAAAIPMGTRPKDGVPLAPAGVATKALRGPRCLPRRCGMPMLEALTPEGFIASVVRGSQRRSVRAWRHRCRECARACSGSRDRPRQSRAASGRGG